MKKKIALVTGSAGQDGSYLCKLLIDKKYKVIAADRRSSRNSFERHKELGIYDYLIYEDFDLTDLGSIVKLLTKYKFDEIYNLAGQSFVQTSFFAPFTTSEIVAHGVLRILETIRMFNLKTKFYQASSSEMFGKTFSSTQNEKTMFYPRSPYGVAKLYAHHITKNYRESFNIFACSGILFNHESPLRGEEFVTKKITKHLAQVFHGKRKYLELGNIESKRDWGFAGDYVEAMWKMLQQKNPDDYVIATNKIFSVKDFVNECFKILKIKVKWYGSGIKTIAKDVKTKKILVKVNPKFFRASEVDYLKGDYSKAKKKLKWIPKTDFKKLVKIMLDYDLSKEEF